MDEAWERAVESALEGQTDPAGVRTLTLDGAVKCLHGRLPPPSVLEKFQNLQQLSIANIGVSSLEQFPQLRNLQKLILSDNRIAGGLEFLVEAGLDSLRDLDLSNNRMQYIEDLAPLAQLRLVSLDLYECPVTRVKDYRSRVFGLIKSLKYLDKMDADENERPESDEEDEEEDDDEEEEDDPGSGEVDGDERPSGMNNGHSEGGEGIVDVDEDEESDADEEEAETGRSSANGSTHQANGFRIGAVGGGEVGDEDEEDGEDEDDDDSGEEVDDDEADDDDDDVVEVHEIEDSDDEEDGVEDDDEDEEEDDDDEEEEVDNEEAGISEPQHQGRLGSSSVEGEIDGHEQGEDDEDEDGDGETGEEEQEVEEVEEDVEFEEDEDGEEEEEDYGAGYLVQPVGQVVQEDAGASDMDPGNEDVEHEEVEEVEEEEEEEVDDEKEVQEQPPSSSYLKRKRDGSGEEEDEEDDEDVIEFAKSSKKHH